MKKELSDKIFLLAFITFLLLVILARPIAAGNISDPENTESENSATEKTETDLSLANCSGFSHDIVRPSDQTSEIVESTNGSLNEEALAQLVLGISVEDLVEMFCEPVRIDPTPFGYEWYIYSRDYYNYFQVGVRDGEVVMIYSNSPNWTFKDYYIGMELADLLATNQVEEFFDIEAADRSLSTNPVQEYESGDIDIVIQPFAVKSSDYDTFVQFFIDINDGDKLTSMLIGDADSTIATGVFGSHFIGQEDELNPYQITAAERKEVELANGYQMFDLLNAIRVREGLDALNWHEKLSEVARSHSIDMAENDFMGHNSPTTGGPGDRIVEAGIDFNSYSENLAFRVNNSIYAHEVLLNSPMGHRENRLQSSHTHIGAGTFADEYYTEKFLQLLDY